MEIYTSLKFSATEIHTNDYLLEADIYYSKSRPNGQWGKFKDPK